VTQRPTHQEPGTIERPPYPLAQMTTAEITTYRRQLESAIEFFNRKDPVPPVRDDLQAKLDDLLAEIADREQIARANGGA
jgi:hypothetical protein